MKTLPQPVMSLKQQCSFKSLRVTTGLECVFVLQCVIVCRLQRLSHYTMLILQRKH